MITLDNVSYYSEKTQHYVLEDISFQLEEGAFLWIQGESGSGKTTLLSLLALQRRLSAGHIRLSETLLTPKSTHHQRDQLRLKIGYMPQENTLFPRNSLAENVALPLQLQRAPYDNLKKELFDLLQWLSLENKANIDACDLSAGEKQRTQLARAIIHRPRLLIADEPFMCLDVSQTKATQKIFKLLHQYGMTIIIASQKPNNLEAKGTQCQLTLKDGRLTPNGVQP